MAKNNNGVIWAEGLFDTPSNEKARELNRRGLPFDVLTGQAINYDMYSDPEIKALMDKFKGTALESEVFGATNRHFNYTPMVTDQMSQWITGASDVSRAFDANRVALRDYLNSSLQKLDSLKQNQPANQVALDRQAGLNPDLSGDVTGTGQINDVDQPMAQPDLFSPQAAASQAIGQLPEVFMSSLNSAMSLASGFQSLRAGQLENVERDLNNQGSMMDFVLKYLANTADVPDIESIRSMSREDWQSYIKGKLGAANVSADFKNFRGSTKRQLGRFFSSMSGKLGAETLRNEYLARYAKSRSEGVKTMSNDLFSDDDWTMIGKWMDSYGQFTSKLTKNLTEYQTKVATYKNNLADKEEVVYEDTLDATSAQQQYNQEVFNKKTGRAKGRADLEAEESRKLSAIAHRSKDQSIKDLNGFIDTAIKDLKDSQAKPWVKVVGQIFLNFLRINMYRYMDSAFSIPTFPAPEATPEVQPGIDPNDMEIIRGMF